jgi:fumarylacetoacetase
MTYSVNDTHDPGLRSWVESAQAPDTDFPIQNLPFGVFHRRGSADRPRVGVGIGDMILDVASAMEAELLPQTALAPARACEESSLNALMALGPTAWSVLRRRLSQLLRTDSPELRSDPALGEHILVPMAKADMHVPAAVGDYTDFYASLHHASNVGSMFRPDNPLLPNYKYIPVGYHGRASSLVVSGTPIRRPNGQTMADDAEAPTFGPSRMLDYELEVGAFVGPGSPLGGSVPMSKAEETLFGLCLVNDWSARDIQKWEYQPLGPFLGKSFATTVSPWVVSLEALEPFRVRSLVRATGDPLPLGYLLDPVDQERGGFDITLEVWLSTAKMRDQRIEPVRISEGTFRNMYWTFAQMVSHHASNGCNLRPGDLLASGTVSGAEPGSRGCLLERTWRGTEPLELPSGETRRFLDDGDEVTLRGYCQRSGAVRIGFGDCRGQVLAARGVLPSI